MSLAKENEVEFHSFHWDNFNPKILEMHRKRTSKRAESIRPDTCRGVSS